MALWLFERFDLSLSAASLFFFWSSVLGGILFPVAAWLSGRIGLINTMVFTHIPSSVFLILAAFSPNLILTLALLLLRSALSQMDVPTRTSYVMAVVTPAERTAAASVTAVPRSLASSLSPALAGALLATPFSGLPLVACGVLKIVYDVALLYMFRHVKPPEERGRYIPPRAAGRVPSAARRVGSRTHATNPTRPPLRGVHPPPSGEGRPRIRASDPAALRTFPTPRPARRSSGRSRRASRSAPA